MTFCVLQEETAEMISKLSEQLRDVLAANKELREENERLRRIY
jgi:regulator of replication initiation timing